MQKKRKRTKIKINKYCLYCNRLIVVPLSLARIKFCSKKCYYRFGRTEKTKEKISKTLKGCIPWNKNKKHSIETKKKISETLKGHSITEWHKKECKCSVCKARRFELNGDKHPCYIKGLKRTYPLEFNKCLKTEIRRRDKFVCQICLRHGWLVHHIDYNKANNEGTNLITVCSSCHGKTNYNRNYWVNYFQDNKKKDK